VFEPFFTTKQAGEGTGLGLAISYEIMQELGGTLRAFNPAQGGACFELLLPLYEDAH
jgi:two-component system C4-dicarboxylate transport sensor histidine kinase DctB